MKDKQKLLEEIKGDLEKGQEFYADGILSCAEYLAEKGYRKVKRGKWVLDTTYQGTSKVIYKCSLCGHWQSSKKNDQKMKYMNYCPFCGAENTLEKTRT